MSRRSRIVIPNQPHHVTQRGGRRQNVFFNPADRERYLWLLKENAARFGVEILDYALMTNHVHFVVVPLEADSLRWTFQMTHKRYADFVNGRGGWTGHLWQQRFYSSPIDLEYLWVAVRYTLRNPVEAHIVKHPADYCWSSARFRCNGVANQFITRNPKWAAIYAQRRDWHEWLGIPEDTEKVALLRKRTSQDLPTGTDQFLNLVEKDLGISVRPPKLGRPRKEGKS